MSNIKERSDPSPSAEKFPKQVNKRIELRFSGLEPVWRHFQVSLLYYHGTFYLINQNQAFQFILCGAIQVCLDSFVIVQIFWYRKNDLYDDKDNKPLSPKYDIEDEIKP